MLSVPHPDRVSPQHTIAPQKLAAEIVRALQSRGMTLAVAESCTAGRLIQLLAAAPGAGEVLIGGVVAYAKAGKARLLGVSPGLLDGPRGAVTPDVAEAMAAGVLRAAGASFAIATTGVAGPERDEDGNPVGRAVVGMKAQAGGGASVAIELGAATPELVCDNIISLALALLKEQIDKSV